MRRALLAVVLTGLLGLERQRAGKAAGLRTHMLVGIAASVFVSMAEVMVLHYSAYGTAVRLDPIAALSAIASGISFLGAGSIIVARSEERVRGLTTAASILVTAAIGVACGLDRTVAAAGLTVLVLLVMTAARALEPNKLDRP